jgi:ComF family protein
MRLTQTVNLIWDAVLSLTYPQRCALCGLSVESRTLGLTCETCWRQTRIFNRSELTCWKCGCPATGILPASDHSQVKCRRCEHQSFTAARACGAYEGALRESVLRLKHQPYLPRRLATLLATIGSAAPLNRSTRIIPVPLHPVRERARGFNQASTIGTVVSKSLNLPLDEVSLIRTEWSEQYRAGLDAKGRAQTVADAFEVRHPGLIAGEDILLVDDVFTTGATASSCAEVLIAAGARNVFVLTIARPVW